MPPAVCCSHFVRIYVACWLVHAPSKSSFIRVVPIPPLCSPRFMQPAIHLRFGLCARCCGCSLLWLLVVVAACCCNVRVFEC